MVSSRGLLPVLVLLAACVGIALGASAAAAATFTVTTTADSFDGVCNANCSLRDAVTAANGDSTQDTILLTAGIYRLERNGPPEDINESGDLDVARSTIIRGAGAGATTVRASFSPSFPDRVFDARAAANLLLEGLTVAGGSVSNPSTAHGGGIRAVGIGLELDGVVVRENRVDVQASGSAEGGGIFTEGANLTVRNSAILENLAPIGFGAGFYVVGDAAVVNFTNVTIALNKASVGGAAQLENESKGEFAFVTVVENTATDSAGGFSSDFKKTVIRSSIFARNSAPEHPDCASAAFMPASLGGNVGPAGCGFTQPTDSAADPLLASLATTGIPVLEPLPGSPAIDRAIGTCPATDARGLPRPQGGGCDSGAAERAVAVPIAGGSGAAKANISGVSVSQTKFQAGPKVVAQPGKGQTPIGTTISFKLSAAATVKATVLRVARGRKVGGKCLAPTPARKGKPSCKRLVGVGTLGSRSFAAGRDKLDFSGRVGGHNLAPGRYRVQLAVPASGTTATTPVLRIVSGRHGGK